MRYIQVNKKEIYTSKNNAVLNIHTGILEPARPELYSPNLREWFIHKILGKHFTFGQPYCVVCGYVEQVSNQT